jgi:quercetin dioxygenase-like cupin family protein
MIKKILLGLSVIAFICAGAALAQQAAIKRTPLQKVEFPDGYATVSGIAEIAQGGAAGRHTHPGIETGYILEGEADLLIDGQPAKHLKAGDSYQIPAGAIHDAKVSGDKPLKVLAVYVVDKTKPLATPAPEK